MLPNILDTKNIKRNTMFYRILVTVFILIVKYLSCENTNGCEGKKCMKSLTVPLLDSLNAPLVAKLDITQFNKQLQEYITEQINQGVEQAKKEISDRMVEHINTFEEAKLNGKLKMISK